MGINRICQCEYIGNYIYFKKLLVESDIEHLDENKSEIFLGSFARWGALFPGATFFCHELLRVRSVESTGNFFQGVIQWFTTGSVFAVIHFQRIMAGIVGW
jgi:hypothetical protein